MVNVHFIVHVTLACAVVAGCFSYLIAPLERVETDARLSPAALNPAAPNRSASAHIDPPPNADELAAAAYQKAAETILRRAPDAQASIDRNEPPIAGPIPLPRSRPIAR
jgi:hypothetical protein